MRFKVFASAGYLIISFFYMVERTDLEPFIFISYPIAVEALSCFLSLQHHVPSIDYWSVTTQNLKKNTLTDISELVVKEKADLCCGTQLSIVWPL
jgi:hypothetical protein